MDRFFETWGHILIGLCVLGAIFCFGMGIYKSGYANGLKQQEHELQKIKQDVDDKYWEGWCKGYDACNK